MSNVKSELRTNVTAKLLAFKNNGSSDIPLNTTGLLSTTTIKNQNIENKAILLRTPTERK